MLKDILSNTETSVFSNYKLILFARVEDDRFRKELVGYSDKLSSDELQERATICNKISRYIDKKLKDIEHHDIIYFPVSNILKSLSKNKKKQLDEERNQKILDLHLQCWTQQQIAKEVELEQKQVSNILGSFSKNPKFLKITKMSDFKQNPYNIWSYGKQGDTDTTVFGTC